MQNFQNLFFDSQIKKIKKQLRELDVESDSDDSDSEDEEYIKSKCRKHESKMPEKKRLEKLRDELYGAMKKCGDAGYKDKVMKECMEQFYVEDFERNLDNNRYLFVFKNGVYDLKKNIFSDYYKNHLHPKNQKYILQIHKSHHYHKNIYL